ncbi:MAG TPA: ATP-binding protein [Steroidobacteraceae bacterium]|jgi:C4-dicarboxylate-specific signal transduction histidine kinase
MGLSVVSLAVLVFGGALWLWRDALRERDRKQSLEEAASRLAFVGSAAGLGLLELESSRTVWTNPQFATLLDLAPATDPTLQQLLDGLSADDQPAVHGALSLARHSRERIQLDVRFVQKEREPRWLGLVVAMRGGSGNHDKPRIAIAALDVTERKHAEIELQRQRQQLAHLGRVSMLGELSGSLAHELNQPLTSILSNAEAGQHFLDERSRDLGEVRDILQDIISDDRRAGEVIRRLRALLTRGETQFQCVEVRQLVSDVLTLEHGELVARNVQVRARIPDSLPPVRADRVEVQQVLLNLFLNACDAMAGNEPESRLIEVQATHGAGDTHVHLSVADRGRGISPESLERVFDPFFTTKREGLGVGLAISRTIIAAHAGRMWATSIPDRGAAFHFTLPVFQEERHGLSHSEGIHRG